MSKKPVPSKIENLHAVAKSYTDAARDAGWTDVYFNVTYDESADRFLVTLPLLWPKPPEGQPVRVQTVTEVMWGLVPQRVRHQGVEGADGGFVHFADYEARYGKIAFSHNDVLRVSNLTLEETAPKEERAPSVAGAEAARSGSDVEAGASASDVPPSILGPGAATSPPETEEARKRSRRTLADADAEAERRIASVREHYEAQLAEAKRHLEEARQRLLELQADVRSLHVNVAHELLAEALGAPSPAEGWRWRVTSVESDGDVILPDATVALEFDLELVSE